MPLEKHKIGASAEFKATAWLLDEGYEVFRNQAQWGPIDLVAYKNDVFMPIEVKTLQHNGRRTDWTFSTDTYLRPEQRNKGIKLLFVLGNIVGWSRDYFPPYKNEKLDSTTHN